MAKPKQEENGHRVSRFERETSWLSFNQRVLQESMDKSVPLLERLKFLAIFSSNLDEFFRVRVASLRSLMNLPASDLQNLNFDPVKLLNRIHSVVKEHQRQFGVIYKEHIIPELHQNNIAIVDHRQLTRSQIRYTKMYFNKSIRHLIQVVPLQDSDKTPFLVNDALYHIVQVRRRPRKEVAPNNLVVTPKGPHKKYLLNIPSETLPRFFQLPEEPGGRHNVMFLDDVIRLCLSELFPQHHILGCFSIKTTRDAELYIEDEYEGDLVEKIKRGLEKRDTGVSTRFLYDYHMPRSLVQSLRRAFNLKKEDLIVGGVYHNFFDFFGFPDFNKPELKNEEWSRIEHPRLHNTEDIFSEMDACDHMLHVPYHYFQPVINLLRSAAQDKNVTSVRLTLYRAAADSAVIKYLIEAARNGKDVTAFVELKARFDEEANLYWATRLEEEGVNVLYSMPGIKVHSKALLVTREKHKKKSYYAYLGTGNFNEKTAKLYSDTGLFTADSRLTKEVRRFFDLLGGSKKVKRPFKHIVTGSPDMRKVFLELIDKEIAYARSGKKGGLTLKMNSLEDRKTIAKLHEAAEAGVKIKLIVRGICCFSPPSRLRKNVKIISIVDRYLEHSRIFVFNNLGDKLYYLSSADWMKRNLSRRIELAFPVYDEAMKSELKRFLEIQWNDNVKARIIDKNQVNDYRLRSTEEPIQSQKEIWRWLKEQAGAVIDS